MSLITIGTTKPRIHVPSLTWLRFARLFQILKTTKAGICMFAATGAANIGVPSSGIAA
jgi:hypothetical protein